MSGHTHHEVISAFIDNEPFNANELGAALATPEGREMLLDLIALGHVIGADATTESIVGLTRKRTLWPALAAAAAIVVALGGGYFAGQRTASEAPATATALATNSSTAPAPTRVIQVDTWQQPDGGR